MSSSHTRRYKIIIYILLGIFSPFLFFIAFILFPLIFKLILGMTGKFIGLIISFILVLAIIFSIFGSQRALRKWSLISYSITQKIFIYGAACIWWLLTLSLSAGLAGAAINTNRAKSRLVHLIRSCWILGRLEFNENPDFGTLVKNQKIINTFKFYEFIDPSTGVQITSEKASKSSCLDISAISSNTFMPSLRVTLPKTNDNSMIPPQNFTESLMLNFPEFNKKAWSIKKPDQNNLKTTCKQSNSFLIFGCDPSKNDVGKAW